MTLFGDGRENATWGGGQDYIEMEPRVWYPVSACTIIENQYPYPLLVSSVEPAMIAWPNDPYDPNVQYAQIKKYPGSHIDTITWPSPHFRETKTTFTILAGEKISISGDMFIMSRHHRFQVIDTTGSISSLPDNCGPGGVTSTPPDVEEPVDFEFVDSGYIDSVTGNPIYAKVITDENGDIITPSEMGYINENGEFIMTQSSNFVRPSSDSDVQEGIVYETDLTTGEVKELREISQFTDGVKQSVDYNEVGANGIPIVASYTPVAQVAASPIRVELTGETLDVTTDTALAAIPTFATYAEIYIDVSADDAPGIRWTKDASAPADDNGEQDNAGTTIRLLDRDEIDGFLATSINADGTIDGVTPASLTVNYWNIAPDED